MASGKIKFCGDIKVTGSIFDLRKITVEYFVKQGFKQVINTDSTLSFERGNVFLNMVATNPLKWKSKFKIVLKKGIVNTDFEINTIYQMVTHQEEKVWFDFVQNYQQSIRSGKLQITDNKKLIKQAKRATLRHFMYALLGGFIFGTPGVIISYYTGINAIATAMGIGGAMFFMNISVDKDKTENR